VQLLSNFRGLVKRLCLYHKIGKCYNVCKKMCGYVVSANMLCVLTKGLLDSYSSPTQESRNYKSWIAVLDLKTCFECRSRHGQIYQMDEVPDLEPPLHFHCRCEIKPMEAVLAG
jgi:SPP1 gp7 family putative phage head morphogenesis protein